MDESAGPYVRYPDADQDPAQLETVAREVARILTPNEEILYIAFQNATALTTAPDCVVVTSNRLILYRPHILGRLSFADFQWQDVRDVDVRQGVLSAELTVTATDGRQDAMSNLHKEQAKRVYGLAQQMEQEWREKRRVRQMEEERARAGGVVLELPKGAAPEPSAGDDQVARLARAKALLDQGLISEDEYQALKAKILSSI
jgi:hypothetical protein